MRFNAFIVGLTALVLSTVGGGCSWVPKSKLTALEAQNKQLQADNQTQLAELKSLKHHSRKLEDELVRTPGGEAKTRDLVAEYRQAARSEWDAYKSRTKLTGYGAARSAGGGATTGGAATAKLAELAKRYTTLNYDAELGICKYRDDVLFDAGRATIPRDQETRITDLAAILNAPEAKAVTVMIVGHADDRMADKEASQQLYRDNWDLSAARALAVAEQLRTAGLAGDRIGVSSFGQHQPKPADKAADARSNRRVEIFLLEPNLPVAGRVESTRRLY